MMHRQTVRMANAKYPDFHFDTKFWTRQWPYKLNDVAIFGDLEVVKDYPRLGLQVIAEDKVHDVHIMIQSHMNFLDPEYVGAAVNRILDSPT